MRTLTAVFLASLLAVAPAGAGVDVVVVGAYAGNNPSGGDPAPDGDGVFFGSGIPVINDAGEVVFVCTFTAGPGGTARETGIVRGSTATGSLRLVVRQGDPAPDGNGNFQRMDPTVALATINDSGQVAFSATFVGTFGNPYDTTGVLRGDVGPDHLTLIARGGETVDGVQLVGLDTPYTAPKLNASGEVVFTPTLTPAIIRSVGGTKTVVVRQGDAAPDASGTIAALYIEAPALNDAGEVAFVPEVTGNANLIVEFLRADGSTITQVVHDGAVPPDQNGTFDLFMTAIIAHAPALNASGEIAFLAALAGASPPATKGIFRAADPAHVVQIVRRGAQTPDGNGSFLDFNFPGQNIVAFNGAGQAAFMATLTGTAQGSADNVGIFRGAGGALVRVVRKGQAAPNADGTFSVLNQPAINASGQVAFLATLANTTKPNGIFLYDDVDGLIQVVRQGDPLLGSTIAFLDFAPDTSLGRQHVGINASGQVAFQFGLNDGRGGVAVWTPGATTTTTTTTTATSTTVHTSSTTSTTSGSSSSTTSTTVAGATSTTTGPSTSTTAPATSTTTVLSATTTTSLPPCTTLRCIVDMAEGSSACAADTLPTSITSKLDRAITQAELAPSETPKKAKRLYKSAAHLLIKARKAVPKATHGRHPKLSPECAAALMNAISAGSGLVVPPA
jgi:hypothetical protein